MKKKSTLTLICLTLFGFLGVAQFVDGSQSFEGADTTLAIDLGSDSNTVWMIGEPAKTIFDQAYSVPNAILTDTASPYPVNDSSSFILISTSGYADILAFQWMQKLDLEEGKDFGLLEFSTNSGTTWENVFDNPNVYNLYGYQDTNVHVMGNGMKAFSGTDSTWRNVWVCLDGMFFQQAHIRLRFTLLSDSVQTNQEGWVMDNFYLYQTWLHTLMEEENAQKEPVKVYPTLSDGRVYLQLKAMQDEHEVESVIISNMNGAVVQRYGHLPRKYFFDLSDQSNGQYVVTVTTNKVVKSFPIILKK